MTVWSQPKTALNVVILYNDQGKAARLSWGLVSINFHTGRVCFSSERSYLLLAAKLRFCTRPYRFSTVASRLTKYRSGFVATAHLSGRFWYHSIKLNALTQLMCLQYSTDCLLYTMFGFQSFTSLVHHPPHLGASDGDKLGLSDQNFAKYAQLGEFLTQTKSCTAELWGDPQTTPDITLVVRNKDNLTTLNRPKVPRYLKGFPFPSVFWIAPFHKMSLNRLLQQGPTRLCEILRRVDQDASESGEFRVSATQHLRKSAEDGKSSGDPSKWFNKKISTQPLDTYCLHWILLAVLVLDVATRCSWQVDSAGPLYDLIFYGEHWHMCQAQCCTYLRPELCELIGACHGVLASLWASLWVTHAFFFTCKIL